jgi:signal transduction histidine kinase
MNTLVPDALSSRMAAATDFRDIGAVLADVLAQAWTADAVVLWRPATDAGPERTDDLFVSGECLQSCTPADLIAPLREHRVDRWLADRGLAACHIADFPPAQMGRIIAAWRHADAVPRGVDETLALVAAHVSLLNERRQFEGRLAAATAAQLEAEDQMVRTRRMRAVGEMASGIAHDFNNCLTSILGFAELALGPLQEGDAFFNDLSGIRMSALDAAALVRRLQSLGRQGRQADEREIVDLRDVARLMPSLARPRWTQISDRHDVSFEVVVDARPVPTTHVVVAEIRELLLNLLFNAVDAMPSGGRITIATRETDEGWAEISVADEGLGMSDEVAQRIFQPFFSTKGDLGSGLGLSVCQTIARRHSARLEVRSVPGEGTTFTLTLPPAAPGLVVAPAPTRVVARPVAAQRVLLVDDQEEVRESVGEMLRAMGHRVTVADSGEAAVSLVRRQQIDVLITDLGMPGMGGLEVAQRFLVLAPRIPVVIFTGWTLDCDTVRPSNVVFVLGKPVTMKALDDALMACVAEAASDGWRKKCS